MQPQADLSIEITLDALSIQMILSKTGLAVTYHQAQQIAYDIQGRPFALKVAGEPMDLSLLLHTVPFTYFTAGQMAFAMEDAYSVQALQVRLEENPFVILDAENKQYYLHPVLQDVLALKLEGADPALRRHCYRRAGLWYAEKEETIKAIEMFWPIRDYASILSLRLTNLMAVRIDGESIAGLAAQILRRCPVDIQRKHPLSLLRLAYLLAGSGQVEAFSQWMPKIKQLLLKEYEADWYFILALSKAYQLEEMLSLLEKARDLSRGQPVQVFDATEPFLFGLVNVFSFFHQKPGEADAEAEQVKQMAQLYNALTGGGSSGAVEIFLAGLQFSRGNLSESIILCNKAAYLSKTHKQGSLYLSAAHLLAETAVHRADTDGFAKALAMMEAALGFCPQNAPLLEVLQRLCKASLHLVLDKPQYLPGWILEEDIDFGNEATRGWVAYLQVCYRYLTEPAVNALGFSLGVLETYGNRQSMFLTLIQLLAALAACKAGGQEVQAYFQVSQALSALDPDNLCLPAGVFYTALQPLIDRYYEENNPPQRKQPLQEIAQNYAKGRLALQDTFFGEETTEQVSKIIDIL